MTLGIRRWNAWLHLRRQRRGAKNKLNASVGHGFEFHGGQGGENDPSRFLNTFNLYYIVHLGSLRSANTVSLRLQ